MKKILLLAYFIGVHLYTQAQAGTWTWVKGANTLNDPGIIGTKGVPNATNYPDGRYQAANWIDLNGNFWIFGGLDSSHQERNDLWKFNPTTREWTWVNGPLTRRGWGIYGTQGVPSPANIPDARAWGMSSWTDKQGRLWLHGGYQSYAFFDDIWMYDIPTNQWTWMKGSGTGFGVANYGTLQVPNASNTPGGIGECNTAWVKSDGTLWKFGGWDENYKFKNDMWRFDIATNNWTWMNGTGNLSGNYGTLNVEAPTNIPPARATYTSWQDANDNFYIYGGIADFSNRITFNDVWKYNTLNNQWTWISGSNLPNATGNYTQTCVSSLAAVPPARYENRTAQMLGCSNLFWTFGGVDQLIQNLNDLWSFNTITKKWTWVSGSNTVNSTGSYGSLNIASTTNQPPARSGVCLWIQPNGNIWMWGGMKKYSPKFNDMWVYIPDTACVGSALFVPPLSAQLTDSSICPGDSSSIIITGGQVLSISPSNSTYFSDSAHIKLTPSSSTTYKVIANGNCGAKDTFYFPVTVVPPPVAGLSFVTNPVKLGNAVFLQNTSTGYDSLFAIINGQNVYPVPATYTPTQAGTSCITLVAIKRNFCRDSATACVLVINDSCNRSFTSNLAPPVICSGDSTYLTLGGARNFSISPALSATKIDTAHAWLYPTVSSNFQLIYTNQCNKLDTFLIAVSVTKSDTTLLTKSICTGTSFQFNGVSLTTAGQYYDTLQNKLGCDSFIVLNLSTVNPTTTSINLSLCGGASTVFNGQTISTAGIYRDTLLSSLSCDSFVVLNLSTVNSTTTSINLSLCSGASTVFNGQTINTAGVYRDTLLSSLSCDSFIVLNLSTVNPTTTSINQSLCSGASTVFNGQTISTAGIYRDTLLSSLSCDSFIVLNLSTVNPTTTSINLSLCSGASTVFNGQTISTAGVYRDTLLSSLSCDSLIVLNLSTVNPTTTPINLYLCGGASTVFNGQTISTAGVYRDTLLSSLSCDSFIELTVSLNPPPPTFVSKSICKGSNIVFNNQTISTSGIYRDTLKSVFNCDSIVVLDLLVLSSKRDTVSVSFCEGESITIGNRTFTQEGYFTDTISTTNCDSFQTVHVITFPKPSIKITPSDSIVNIGEEVQLNTNGINTFSYLWTSSTTLSNATIQNPSAVFYQSAWVTVQATSVNNCHAYDSLFITVNDCESTIYVPNAFTPNGDKNNDGYRIFGNCIRFNRLVIFNRWGEKVWETSDMEQEWNGYYKGVPQPSGVYVYSLSYNSASAKGSIGKELKGSITLIR